MAEFQVTNTNSAGSGSLANAIQQANSVAGADTIRFVGSLFTDTTPDTIYLNEQLIINSDTTIVGTGKDRLVISGDKNKNGQNDDGDVRVFFVNQGTVSISNLTVANGRAKGGDGGSGFLGGGGGAGVGGGIFIKSGAVSIDSVIFQQNNAIGGAGGDIAYESSNSSFGGGGGGGLFGNGGNTFGVHGGGGGSSIENGKAATNSGPGVGGIVSLLGGSAGTGGRGGLQYKEEFVLAELLATNGGKNNGLGAGGGGGGTKDYDYRFPFQYGFGGDGGDFGGGGGGSGNGGFGGGGGGGKSISLFGGGIGAAGAGSGDTLRNLADDPAAAVGAGSSGDGGVYGGGGGGAGLGGAVFVNTGSSLTLARASFVSNSAIGGRGGKDDALRADQPNLSFSLSGQPGFGYGGALFIREGATAQFLEGTVPDGGNTSSNGTKSQKIIYGSYTTYSEPSTGGPTDNPKDPFTGGLGNDDIKGDDFNNTLTGNDGNDTLRGYGGDDLLLGGFGDDILSGGLGNDNYQGGDGNDVLSSGRGSDTLTGGSGRDAFGIGTGNPFSRNDTGIITITDFEVGQDKIYLSKQTFNTKKLRFKSVNNARQAKLSQAALVYVAKTGALFYNQNGALKGFGSGGQIADLTDGLRLTDADIVRY